MFTGIVECVGIIEEIVIDRTNKRYWISSPVSDELRVDQSVSHNGICLTVEQVLSGKHLVTAVSETINKTDIEEWQKGKLVNIERCLPFNGRLDGHLMQGHVDAVGICVSKKDEGGSWRFSFEYDRKYRHLLVDKGSIAVSGVSLTVISPGDDRFEVAIIPYTYEHTIFKNINVRDKVNLEFDIVGKYVLRYLQTRDY